MEEIYLTVKELAELKGCTERYVRKWIAEGGLQAEQISGLATGQGGIQYRIPLSSLERKLQTKFKRRLRAVEQAVDSEDTPTDFDLEGLTGEEREQIIF